MKEIDLFEPVKILLENNGYTVHAEVKDCDIIAVNDNEIIGIEMKKSFNASLLIQAVQRQKTSDCVYIAIPHPGRGIFQKKWHKICYLIKRLELGLILVKFTNNNPRAEISFHPAEHKQYKSKKQKAVIIREISGRSQNLNIGGSTGEKILTSYKESAIFIACCLDKFGPLSPKKLKELGTSDKTSKILYDNFYGWFDKVKYGVYSIHEDGYEALKNYQNISKIYYDKLKRNT